MRDSGLQSMPEEPAVTLLWRVVILCLSLIGSDCLSEWHAVYVQDDMANGK